VNIIALAAHLSPAPLRNELPHVGYGSIDEENVATCTELRFFERCTCERPRKNPTRGHPDCTRCHGAGAVVVRIEDGCGTTFGLCGACGNRTVINGIRCPNHGQSPTSGGLA